MISVPAEKGEPMADCNCVYEEFCKLVNGGDIVLPKPCGYRKDSTDFAEVVRCKDCVHMAEHFGGRYCKIWTMFNGMGDDGFCNYGERKNNVK
jgi:hypothetical protein